MARHEISQPTPEEISAYEQEVLDELNRYLENEQNDLGINVTHFISRSKGRGRDRKYPKDVTLVTYSGRTHEYDPGRYPNYHRMDTHAQEIFPEHDDPLEALREFIEDSQKIV